MIFNMTGGAGGASKLPSFSYTGQYQLIDDGKDGAKQNWRVKFLTSGTLTFAKTPGAIEAFLVGGGGGGAVGSGGGGGGGYTRTVSYSPEKGVAYAIEIGAGGGESAAGGGTNAFGASVDGGAGGIDTGTRAGGAGGSGGGGGRASSGSTDYGGFGGSDGGDGYAAYASGGSPTAAISGQGQQTTTREFGAAVTKAYAVGATPLAADWLSLTDSGTALTPASGVVYSVMTEGDYWYHDYIWDGSAYVETDVARVYAGGGGGGAQDVIGPAGAGGGGAGAKSNRAATSGVVNTGGGGGGGTSTTYPNGTGGSGIVVIRNYREVTA